MKIPKNLNLNEFKTFIFKIAEKIQVKLTEIEFNPNLKSGGIAYFWDKIELRIPLRKRYNPRHFLYVIIHEMAHLYQKQYQDKWGHEDLEKIIPLIYRKLGWMTDSTYYRWDTFYIKTATEKERKERKKWLAKIEAAQKRWQKEKIWREIK